VHHLDEAVVARGEQAAQRGPEPVYPMVARERARRYGAAEAARRVQRPTRVVDTCESKSV
jgi:hypothetical protein